MEERNLKVKNKEKILKLLKQEILSEESHINCSGCVADVSNRFYQDIPSSIIGKITIETCNDMSPCFYRFCIILKHYFNVETAEIVKIYKKHGRAKELVSCQVFASKKKLQQEIYNLCFKHTNFNKI